MPDLHVWKPSAYAALVLCERGGGSVGNEVGEEEVENLDPLVQQSMLAGR